MDIIFLNHIFLYFYIAPRISHKLNFDAIIRRTRIGLVTRYQYQSQSCRRDVVCSALIS